MTKLDLDVYTVGICHACLSFVSFAIDGGDRRKIAGQAQSMTPYLWDEGLAEPALVAVRRAYMAEVPDAEEALEELELRGGRSRVARAIVLRLAGPMRRRRSRSSRAGGSVWRRLS